MGYKTKRISYTHSHEEIAKAMRRFREKGGLVQRLSDEENPKKNFVEPRGLMNSSAYEDVMVDGA